MKQSLAVASPICPIPFHLQDSLHKEIEKIKNVGITEDHEGRSTGVCVTVEYVQQWMCVKLIMQSSQQTSLFNVLKTSKRSSAVVHTSANLTVNLPSTKLR